MTDLNKGLKRHYYQMTSRFLMSKTMVRWFLAGLHSRLNMTQNVAGAVVEAQGAATVAKPITIIYGSQTGNAETCAYEAADAAQAWV